MERKGSWEGWTRFVLYYPFIRYLSICFSLYEDPHNAFSHCSSFCYTAWVVPTPWFFLNIFSSPSVHPFLYLLYSVVTTCLLCLLFPLYFYGVGGKEEQLYRLTSISLMLLINWQNFFSQAIIAVTSNTCKHLKL